MRVCFGDSNCSFDNSSCCCLCVGAGAPYAVDVKGIVSSFFAKGYESSKEPLQIQILTTSQKPGEIIGNFSLGYESGFGKALAMLLTFDAIDPTLSADELASLTMLLKSFNKVQATYTPCSNKSELVQRTISVLAVPSRADVEMTLRLRAMVVWYALVPVGALLRACHSLHACGARALLPRRQDPGLRAAEANSAATL